MGSKTLSFEPINPANATTDPECQSFLADLEELHARANRLSSRLDNGGVAVGKLWGVTRGLRIAMDSAEFELRSEEDVRQRRCEALADDADADTGREQCEATNSEPHPDAPF